MFKLKRESAPVKKEIQEISRDELPDVVKNKLNKYGSASDLGLLRIKKIERLGDSGVGETEFKIYGQLDKHKKQRFIGAEEIEITAKVSDSDLTEYDEEMKGFRKVKK